MAFFPAEVFLGYSRKPVILYQDQTIEQLNPRLDLEDLVRIIWTHIHNNKLNDPRVNYFITFVWVDDGDLMTDIWIFGRYEPWEPNPMVDVKNFRNHKLETNTGVACGETLTILGLEARHRHDISSLEEYLLPDNRPDLPPDLVYDSSANPL
jgi:hypothetical protein